MKSVVTIGGGTGQFTLLSGLKKFPVNLTAIVSMADDGGSTGVLRDELGVLPPGDIRQCLVALSESESIMRDLFNYRYDQGGLKGHNFGNIFLSTLEKLTGSFEEAVRVAGMVLAIRGSVIPVTTGNVSLVCGKGDKACVGEHAINSAKVDERETLRLEPAAYANPKAVAALEAAECIVIGPGNLFCSIIPNLLVKGIAEAIARSNAKVVYNCNLMTKAGHTDGFSVLDFVDEIERYVGKGRLDYVTFNETAPRKDLLVRYAEEGTFPVFPPEGGFPPDGPKPLPAELISTRPFSQKPGDPIRRTFIRHDPDTLATLIVQHCLGGL
ncbi:MAG TPA: gluconeogenesis factor YvcK family protein [Candidatus Eisenbacteria bacterium]|nr:gluconeogenesis factor YvcK family protein [Candidatus Eisenbacteria bacterium]